MGGYRSLEWRTGELVLLDQRALPGQLKWVICRDHRQVAEAIRGMVVRGAPAIGAAAAYGLALAALSYGGKSVEELLQRLELAARDLRGTRPTAVNLFWAVERVMARARGAGSVESVVQAVMEEAELIAFEDEEANRRIGAFGMGLLPDEARVVHHCNTGSLATVEYGTALGIVRAAHEAGKRIHVYVDETRPRLQGARLTAWELLQLGIPHTVIVDGASGHVMKRLGVDLCLVGCDRVARNGDVANKIGTYNLAVVARAHRVPFYVAAPTSTIDLETANGEQIEIEERGREEVSRMGGEEVVPEGSHVYNPAFDVTPAEYVTAIVTEVGVAHPPYEDSLPRLVQEGRRWREGLRGKVRGGVR
jgi:methylthioribose-1-phosphate isomerase